MQSQFLLEVIYEHKAIQKHFLVTHEQKQFQGIFNGYSMSEKTSDISMSMLLHHKG
jgi:hypothetical protein